ncbi:gas vesicle protein [Mesobacillus selenatarsenatis]|uniref:Putative gas vesicle synthesis protein n=1 Tax=Mesobacillus selenatarsenatis (strain DSM 18680 / JCM 14380 / FERM P-15431 / SF-1) TaxID=1321606 RepID=A0A0A8X5F5_MESS1|nr:gas vesicle protein [Mesobacillus selenatarsenatis]GAM14469.1 putative gas vesicle synthesis protein [Mesobacillus selenatarsenatis SF-1]
MSYQHTPQSSNLLEVLEKILDKGVVIAGDIKISLADVDLLTIKIRLLVASVDKAKEIGMDWWETDPYYSTKSKRITREHEHIDLMEKVNRLEQLVEKQALMQQLSLPEKVPADQGKGSVDEQKLESNE